MDSGRDGDDDTVTTGDEEEASGPMALDNGGEETSSEAEDEGQPSVPTTTAAVPMEVEEEVSAPKDVAIRSKNTVKSGRRIKLKMPKLSSSAPLSSRRPTLSLPKKSTVSEARQATGDVVSSGGSGKSAKKARLAPPPPPSSGILKKQKSSKSRIRSLKLPLTKKVPAMEENAVDATVVNSEEEDDADGEEPLVAAVISSGAAAAGSAGQGKSSLNASASSTTPKRRAINPSRPSRLPPIFSPGLLVPASNANRQEHHGNTPAEVFENAMKAAGYTSESRTERPHRGSSVTREVGDLFDSNIKLSLHFPPLIPPNFWGKDEDCSRTNGVMNGMSHTQSPSKGGPKSIAMSVLDGLRQGRKPNGKNDTDDDVKPPPGKRRRATTLRDMVPVSLSLPYPEDFLKSRLDYITRVHEREKAIVQRQEAEEECEIRGEPYNDSVEVPPIPEPPPPPTIKEFKGMQDKFEDSHPYYFPKSHEDFVAHLDRRCFHITEGRYFGLSSNNIGDPSFVGANAPGVASVTAAGGTALATSTVGGGSIGTGLILSSSYYEASAISSNPKEVASATSPSKPPATDATAAESPTEKEVEKSTPSNPSNAKSSGPLEPTSSSSSLRKLMEGESVTADSMRDCIVRAAVHASRTGSHGESFQGPDGEIYPDVSKAFAAYAGVKPCSRCKNNKQGAYHCRLRRKHREVDFDEGDSMAEIRPLFYEPLESLLINVEREVD